MLLLVAGGDRVLSSQNTIKRVEGVKSLTSYLIIPTPFFCASYTGPHVLSTGLSVKGGK